MRRPDPKELANPDLTDEELFKLYEPMLREAQRDPRRIRGHVAASHGVGKTGALHWADSTFPNGRPSDKTVQGQFEANDPIVKRSNAQRTEAMAKRLWDAIQKNPQQAGVLLKYVHEAAWRDGMPVSYDDLKEVAVELLRKAAAKKRR